MADPDLQIREGPADPDPEKSGRGGGGGGGGCFCPSGLSLV